MSESRRDILEMLAKGQITTDEAERLLGLLENKAPTDGPRDSTGSRAKTKPEYLRVVVESDEGYDSGATVNVRVPMQLLRAGVRLAGLLPVQARGPVNDALRSHGCPSIFRRSDRRTWKNWSTSSATSLLMSLKTGKR